MVELQVGRWIEVVESASGLSIGWIHAKKI